MHKRSQDFPWGALPPTTVAPIKICFKILTSHSPSGGVLLYQFPSKLFASPPPKKKCSRTEGCTCTQCTPWLKTTRQFNGTTASINYKEAATAILQCFFVILKLKVRDSMIVLKCSVLLYCDNVYTGNFFSQTAGCKSRKYGISECTAT